MWSCSYHPQQAWPLLWCAVHCLSRKLWQTWCARACRGQSMNGRAYPLVLRLLELAEEVAEGQPRDSPAQMLLLGLQELRQMVACGSDDGQSL